MRVYISVDMEGVAGVVHEDQTNPVDPRCAVEYARFRALMTGEANAAVEGALEAGATRVLVNDSHWLMRNLLVEQLHPAAELLSGDPKPRSMMEGIDLGFDAALFIGYHARAGTPNAILDHTYADRIQDVRLNGRAVGELGLNAALAGSYGVPVVLVSGDAALAAEAKDLLGPEISAIIVKEAVSRHAARSVAPEVARRKIKEGTAEALRGRRNRELFAVPPPVTIEVDFASTIQADMAGICPGATRVAGRTVGVTQQDYREAFRAWRAILNLSAGPV